MTTEEQLMRGPLWALDRIEGKPQPAVELMEYAEDDFGVDPWGDELDE